MSHVMSDIMEGREDGVKDIVVCSWMPQGVDFTAEFRKAGVDGYVLIGEV